MNSKISWYVSRLKTQSSSELIQRVLDFALSKIEKKLYINKKFSLSLLEKPKQIFEIPHIKDFPFSPLFPIFEKKINISREIDFHKDIKNKLHFPKSFSKEIDIRFGKFGSAKYVWEINRLQFLVPLAVKFKSSENIKYLNIFQKIITSWIKENPYLAGVNWQSNLEVNLRLISFILAWQILNACELMEINAKFKSFCKSQWIPEIYKHCVFSRKNPSRFSSANNHAIGEFAGLYLATSVFRFRESKAWNEYAVRGLEREIIRQHSRSGINLEQASAYQIFTAELLLLCYSFDKLGNSNSLSGDFLNRLRQIIDYICAFTDKNLNHPNYGDNDDGQVWWSKTESDRVNSLLVCAAILFEDPAYKSKSMHLDTKNRIMFGDEGEKIYNDLKRTAVYNKSAVYQSDGYAILRKRLPEKREIFLNFKCTPLGLGKIAAHGHADALSFTLNINGVPFIIDSGTYTYHEKPELRKYFVGISAHNTIRINTDEPARYVGPTLWLDHYKAKIESTALQSDIEVVRSSHNGYLRKGFFHKRSIKFDKRKNKIEITDKITNKKRRPTKIEFFLHINPQLRFEIKNEKFLVRDEFSNAAIEIETALDSKIISGQKKPLLGWYSKKFDQVMPSRVVYAMLEGNRPFYAIKTIISVTS